MKKTKDNQKRIQTPTIFTIVLSVAFASSIFYYDYNLNKHKEAELGEQNIVEHVNEEEITTNIALDNSIDEAPKVENDITSTEVLSDEDLQEPEHIVKHAGWIPAWGFSSGVASLETSLDDFYSVSPVWYSVNEDGSLVDRRTSNWISIMKYQDTVQILPSIGVFDADIMHTILSNNTSFYNHINAISNEISQNGYDGIDIDYEVLYLEDKERFLTFIEELANRLHKEDKILSVTILTQWGDDVTYTAFPQTREVQQMDRIAEYADEVRIMTYDYTPSSSNTPGPIAPISWIESVITYTLTKVPAEKLWLGVHLYGYEWDSNGKVRATTYSDIPDLEIIDDYNFMHNHSYEEGIATYTCKTDLTCTIFFQTHEGIEARAKLAEKYKLAGVSYWRLGSEGDLL